MRQLLLVLVVLGLLVFDQDGGQPGDEVLDLVGAKARPEMGDADDQPA